MMASLRRGDWLALLTRIVLLRKSADQRGPRWPSACAEGVGIPQARVLPPLELEGPVLVRLGDGREVSVPRENLFKD